MLCASHKTSPARPTFEEGRIRTVDAQRHHYQHSLTLTGLPLTWKAMSCYCPSSNKGRTLYKFALAAEVTHLMVNCSLKRLPKQRLNLLIIGRKLHPSFYRESLLGVLAPCWFFQDPGKPTCCTWGAQEPRLPSLTAPVHLETSVTKAATSQDISPALWQSTPNTNGRKGFSHKTA